MSSATSVATNRSPSKTSTRSIRPATLERKDGKWLRVREEARVRAPPLAVQPERAPDRLVVGEQRQLGSIALVRRGAHRVGLSVLEPAPTPTGTLVSPPLWRPGSERRFTSMLAASPIRPSSVLRLPFSPRARAQIGLFLLAYLVYSAARFVTIGDLGVGQGQRPLDRRPPELAAASASRRRCRARSTAPGSMWIFNHLYLIAQLGVIPAALIFLWFRSPQHLPDAAQHDPRDVAAVGAGLRPVPGRSPAAGRHRDRGHDQHAHAWT